MIALDDNGNLIASESGLMTGTAYPEIQNAKSECRCNQGEWIVDILYGKNILIWELTTSENDRCIDLYRICAKYFGVQTVTYSRATQRFTIQ